MPDFSILLGDNGAFEQAPLPLYALPARAWHTDEYRGLLASEVGPSMAVISEPQREAAWSGTSIAEMATQYADLIVSCEAGRRRPLALFGWSVGALVALETARQLVGRLQVAWVGVADGSTFPHWRRQLAEIPRLSDEERPVLEASLARWLEKATMREPWHQLLRHMSGPQRDVFLREVGMADQAMPTDGPQPGSQEHALWSRLNCLRLGLSCALPKVLPAPVRWWRSEEMSGMRDELHESFMADPACGAVEVVQGSDHLNMLEAPAFHRMVAQALAQRVPGETTLA